MFSFIAPSKLEYELMYDPSNSNEKNSKTTNNQQKKL